MTIPVVALDGSGEVHVPFVVGGVLRAPSGRRTVIALPLV
jgi:hypothetical protein